MSINEAYSMLLTHEARLESANSNASNEAKMNYAANLVQTGNNSRTCNYNAGWNIITIKETILEIMETELKVEIGMEIMVEVIIEQGDEVIQDMVLQGDNGMEIREVIKAEVVLLDSMVMDLLLVSIILEEEVAEVSYVRFVSS